MLIIIPTQYLDFCVCIRKILPIIAPVAQLSNRPMCKYRSTEGWQRLTTNYTQAWLDCPSFARTGTSKDWLQTTHKPGCPSFSRRQGQVKTECLCQPGDIPTPWEWLLPELPLGTRVCVYSTGLMTHNQALIYDHIWLLVIRLLESKLDKCTAVPAGRWGVANVMAAFLLANPFNLPWQPFHPNPSIRTLPTSHSIPLNGSNHSFLHQCLSNHVSILNTFRLSITHSFLFAYFIFPTLDIFNMLRITNNIVSLHTWHMPYTAYMSVYQPEQSQ